MIGQVPPVYNSFKFKQTDRATLITRSDCTSKFVHNFATIKPSLGIFYNRQLVHHSAWQADNLQLVSSLFDQVPSMVKTGFLQSCQYARVLNLWGGGNETRNMGKYAKHLTFIMQEQKWILFKCSIRGIIFYFYYSNLPFWNKKIKSNKNWTFIMYSFNFEFMGERLEGKNQFSSLKTVFVNPVVSWKQHAICSILLAS